LAKTLSWQIYERVAACFEVEAASMDVSVTPNASLIGSISHVSRQIDILVDARFEEGFDRRIIFDAKHRKRKVDVKDIESFEGMMRDVNASRGVLICSSGWSQAAASRAADLIDIRLMTVDEIDEMDFAAVDPCPHCRLTCQRNPGLVFWDGQFPLPLDGWAIIFSGKCDRCRCFAFWCWECGEKVIVPDKEVYTCGCDRKWFIEKTPDAALFVVDLEGNQIQIDRRPLR
jgi:hypothetical protein